MSNLDKLFNAISVRNLEIAEKQADDRVELSSLFLQSLKTTMKEIRRSKPDENGKRLSEDFSELVIVNLITMGAKEGYSAAEMRDFVMELKQDQRKTN